MTGYHLSVGYISGYSAGQDRSQAWEVMKEIVARLRQEPGLIAAEAARIEPGTLDECLEFAQNYHPSVGDLTVVVREGDPQEVAQSASGGGCERAMKEKLRRAFSRLVIEQMHRHGFEVNLNVA